MVKVKTEKGETILVSPFVPSKTFTSQAAYNIHVSTWEGVCEANGWNTDGTPKEPSETSESSSPQVELSEEQIAEAEEAAKLAAEIALYTIEDSVGSNWKVISYEGNPVGKANGQANAVAEVERLAIISLAAKVGS